MLMIKKKISLMFVSQIITRVKENVVASKQIRKLRYDSIWVTMKIAKRWKQLLLRRGGDMEMININKTRRALTFVGNMRSPYAKERAYTIL